MDNHASKILGMIFIILSFTFMFVKNTWDLSFIFPDKEVGANTYFIVQMVLFSVMFLGLKRLFRLEKMFVEFLFMDFFFNAAALNALKEIFYKGTERMTIEYICIGLSAIISFFQYRFKRKEFLK